MNAVVRHIEEFDLRLSSGRLHAARVGGTGPLVVCLPGLSANLRCFDLLGARLADRGFRVVAVDLRGRGRSETTPPGTYGWRAHADDVSEVAQQLGGGPIHVLGWSMGAFVAMQLAATSAQLVDKVVLIDACAATSEPSNRVIRTVLERLGVVHPSVPHYLERVKQTGTILPWDPLWERYFEYELESVEHGVKARTSRDAVAEDFAYGVSHDPRQLWPGLTMPVLLVRAGRPILPDGPFIVSEDDRDAFEQRVPTAKVVEVDANHYGVVTHPETSDAIVEFLRAPLPHGGP